MHDRTRISKKWIARVRQLDACWTAAHLIEWTAEKPRTWGELKRGYPHWYHWMMVNIPDLPLDLTGVSSYRCARIMTERPDYKENDNA